MFYVDHNNRKTQWVHPQVSEAQMKEQDLIVSILSFSYSCRMLVFNFIKFRHLPSSLNQWNLHIACNYSNIQ